MNLRCFRCGWSFTINRETAAGALAAAQAAQTRHYDMPCPKCRQVIKISVDQLRRAAPPAEPTPPAAA